MKSEMKYPGSLHNHTDFSNFRLRDCINKVEGLIDYAISLGHDVIAITDHETISNAIRVEKYYNKIKKDHPNFKIIRGNEIYLCRNGLNSNNYESKVDKFYHFILLAKDAIGHRQIRELSTRAWNRSFSYKKTVRVPTYYQDLFDIIGKEKGHIIGTTACLGGVIPTQLLKYRDVKDEKIWNNIIYWLQQMNELFGKDNFYLEMQPSNDKDQIYVNKKLLEISKQLNIGYIITTDSHYTSKEKRSIHKAFLNSQDGDREVDAFYATTYLMDTEELESFFSYFDEDTLKKAYININKIKNNTEDYSLLKPLKIPQLRWREYDDYHICLSKPVSDLEYYSPWFKKFAESENEADRKLAANLCAGLLDKKDCWNEKTYREIDKCLEMTWISSEKNNASWSAYYLNFQKIIEECWKAGTIVGPGRGSGVGFILLYLLEITQINPLLETTKTERWRFLNPDRVSVLDIDVDIESGRRNQVLQHLRDVYGEDMVAGVATFGTEKSKSAIQTACRGLGIDIDISLYLSSLVEEDRGMPRTLHQTFYGDEENGYYPNRTFIEEMTEKHPDVWEVAQEIEGLICRLGMHAGGVIFVDEPFTNSTALMRAPSGDIITQFELHDCEDVS